MLFLKDPVESKRIVELVELRLQPRAREISATV